MSCRTVDVQQGLTFDLPGEAGKCRVDYPFPKLKSPLDIPSLTVPRVYTICGCLEQRGQRGRRLTMKRMNRSTAMTETIET